MNTSGDRFLKAIDLLSRVESADALIALLAAEPWLLSDETLAELEAIADAPEFAAALAIYPDLFRDARVDPAAAWERFSAWMRESERVGTELSGEVIPELESLVAEHEWDAAIELASDHLQRAEDCGQTIIVGFLRSVLGKALLHTTSGNHAENVEAAGRLLESAAQIAPDDNGRADALMDLAYAFTFRIRGDPRENVERAYELLKSVLEGIDLSDEPKIRTTVQTNIAELLQRREEGDRIENLRDAERYCLEALEWRTRERDLTDWAYTVLNLAATRELLASLGNADLSLVEVAYAEVTAEAERLIPAWLAAHAYGGLARIAELRAMEAGDQPDAAALSAARTHLERALKFVDEQSHRLLWGRIMNQYARVLDALGDWTAARKAARRATENLSPTFAPVESQEAAAMAGDLLSRVGKWEEAADAYLIAVMAAALRYRQRLTLDDRRLEISRAGNLARWASFALAKADRPLDAVRVLEAGRARELNERARLAGQPETNELETGHTILPPPLAPETLNAPQASSVEDRLAEIRRIPDLEDFDVLAAFDVLASGIQPDWPLVYVNPAPSGIALFLATMNIEGVQVETAVLDHPTSGELIRALLFGQFEGSPRPHSYVAAAAGVAADYGVDYALDYLLPWLGEQIAAPVAEMLGRIGAPGATLIISGPLALTPLHAATWRESGEQVCLLDKVPIRYAPSASLQGITIERSIGASTRRPHLVALGNPQGADLPASEAEVNEIAKLFDAAAIATGPQATGTFFKTHAVEATHLHFACHGRGSPLGFGESAIALSDGEILAEEVPTVEAAPPRLTVISACQTAITNVELVEEVFSIGTVLLAAGSACVIASLWPVDDFATALLMTQLYERLLAEEHVTPARALRGAQLWLRQLTGEAEAVYLTQHPALERAFQARAAARAIPGRRRRGSSAAAERPYDHPDAWAAFVAVGA